MEFVQSRGSSKKKKEKTSNCWTKVESKLTLVLPTCVKRGAPHTWRPPIGFRTGQHCCGCVMLGPCSPGMQNVMPFQIGVCAKWTSNNLFVLPTLLFAVSIKPICDSTLTKSCKGETVSAYDFANNTVSLAKR